LKFASGRIIHDDSPYDKVVSETRIKIVSDPRLSSENEGQEKFDLELKKAKQIYYDHISSKLLDLKSLFY